MFWEVPESSRPPHESQGREQERKEERIKTRGGLDWAAIERRKEGSEEVTLKGDTEM